MADNGGPNKRPRLDAVEYLRSLPAIRERCSIILEAARRDELAHFSLNEDRVGDAADYVNEVIKSRFPGGTQQVPFHSRFRHFEPGGVDRLAQVREMSAGAEKRELARRLVDLVMVSVLLDAGAGDAWKYHEASTGQTLSRSEGLGVASLHMFLEGAFCGDASNVLQVDSVGLKALTTAAIRKGFQVDDEKNPLVGSEGRAELLQKLGCALEEHPEYFTAAAAQTAGSTDGNGDAAKTFRPGYVVDYLFAKANEKHEVSMRELWRVLMFGLESIWPAGRTSVDGHNLGDVWPHSAIPKSEKDASSGLVPFHKLSQWLGYSLLEPLQEAGLVVTETELMTGLPEYRNGGLLVDLGVLVPKDAETFTKKHTPDSELIVEWRALTVVLLDEVAKKLREKLGVTQEQLPLVKVLEGGTWTAGRKVAKERRPETAGPPIVIISDGTVF